MNIFRQRANKHVYQTALVCWLTRASVARTYLNKGFLGWCCSNTMDMIFISMSIKSSSIKSSSRVMCYLYLSIFNALNHNH